MSDLAFTGTTSGQTTTDAAGLSPFAGVTSSASATPYITTTATLSTTADGALSHLGIGTLSADGSTYTVQGSPADVQAALRGLVFTPTLHQVPVGQSVTTGFTLTASDAAGAVTDARTSVVATAADTLPTVTDTSATHAPTSSVADPYNVNDPGRTSITPFGFTSVADPDAGATETTAIVLTQNGAATDAVGLLSGGGLTKTGVGTYTLAAGAPAAETTALEALRFTPAHPGTAASVDVAFTVSDGAGAPVTLRSTLGLSGNPGGQTVVTNSTEALTTYNDTPAASSTHTFATTIEAVLNGTTVVYDQSFNLPYSDPQVQTAVGQAKATLQNAGATAGAPTATASNLTTVASQTNATETGRSTAPGVVTMSETLGLPTYIGPNVSVPFGAANTEANRGYFYILPGQTDINVDTATTTNIDRTVTTTSTDLLSQQYIITGSTVATAALTTTVLVSSNAQGMEGNMGSTLNTIVNGITADGVAVLFTGVSTNLTPTDTNVFYDLYLKNTATGAITLITVNTAGVQANFDTFYGSVDGDGNLVAFTTTATNLDPRGTGGSRTSTCATSRRGC